MIRARDVKDGVKVGAGDGSRREEMVGWGLGLYMLGGGTMVGMLLVFVEGCARDVMDVACDLKLC